MTFENKKKEKKVVKKTAFASTTKIEMATDKIKTSKGSGVHTPYPLTVNIFYKMRPMWPFFKLGTVSLYDVIS